MRHSLWQISNNRPVSACTLSSAGISNNNAKHPAHLFLTIVSDYRECVCNKSQSRVLSYGALPVREVLVKPPIWNPSHQARQAGSSRAELTTWSHDGDGGLCRASYSM